MHRGSFLWTPTPPLADRRTPRPGPVRVCVCLLLLAGSGGPASRARSGAPHLFLWPLLLSALLGPLRAGVAPILVLFFPLSVAVLRAPPLSLAFFDFWPRVPWALALCVVCLVGLALLGPPCTPAPFVLPAWLLLVAWWLPPPPPLLCLAVFPLPPLRSLCFSFPCSRPRCLSRSVVSGPGCFGPWRCALRFFFPLVPRLSVRSPFFFPAWPLAAPWCLVPPPPSFVSGWFSRCRLVPPPFFFSFPACAPLVFGFLWFPAPGALGLGAVFCLLCGPPASCLFVRSLPFLCLGWPLVAPWWLLPPPPPATWCSVLFFFALCAPVVSSLPLLPAPAALGLGAARCLLCWPPTSRLSVRSRLFRASCLAVGCFLVVAAPPPLLCLAVFVASARCCVPCVVLCCVSRVAVLRCAAARCVTQCCAVVCCVVLLLSVGAVAGRAVPSGAHRRPGALCFAALCSAVFPRAVCVLSLRGGVCCCSPLCFVLCVSWGAVLCVPCPLRSVRCCALLCWCACIVLFVWCVLLLAPGAVVRCRVLCCFLSCAVVRSWVWWPVVVCWCHAVAPRCPFFFAGGLNLCLFPVSVVLCCSVPVESALLSVPRAVACPCVLWCLPGRSAVWWCRSAVSWCVAVLCIVLWCPAPCAVS